MKSVLGESESAPGFLGDKESIVKEAVSFKVSCFCEVVCFFPVMVADRRIVEVIASEVEAEEEDES